MKFGLIISDTNRSKAYVNSLIKNLLLPEEVFFFSKKENKYFKHIFIKNKIKYYWINKDDINHYKVTSKILKSEFKNFIYSGYSGQIIRSEILKKKNLIHCHSGSLPKYKGSTTIFYSLIKENKIACSVFKMTEKIDTGKIYYIKKFNPPKNLNTINTRFDDNIRSKTIIDFLKKKKKIVKNKKYYDDYYIAHPFIRRLAINKASLLFIKKLY
jgi:methionyl-tRNA formyltransferase